MMLFDFCNNINIISKSWFTIKYRCNGTCNKIADIKGFKRIY